MGGTGGASVAFVKGRGLIPLIRRKGIDTGAVKRKRFQIHKERLSENRKPFLVNFVRCFDSHIHICFDILATGPLL